MISFLSQHSFNKMNTSNTLSSAHTTMSAATICRWGTDLSYEEAVSRHTPSGKWNHLVASIILDARSGRPLQRLSRDTPFDSPAYRLQVSLEHKQEEEKRFLALIKKTKEELKDLAISSDEDSATADQAEEEEEEDEDVPEPPAGSAPGRREKTGSDPKWLQNLKDKKQKQQEALKRKSLLSSLKTQSESLAEVQKTIADDRAELLKLTMLQELHMKLQKAIHGAESTYRRTLDRDFLHKNIHYNMELWEKKSAPLLPPPKMVQRLVGSPGAFKTVTVPEHEQPIIPLEEYLREDW